MKFSIPQFSKWEWKQLPVSEQPNHSQEKSSQLHRYTCLILTSSVLCLLSLGFLSYLVHQSQDLSFPSYLDTEHKYHCGNSSEEAIDLGCVFDELTIAWLPRQCPRTQETEFNEAMGWRWPFWADKEGKLPLDRQALSRWDDKEYYTTQREHSNHCIFMFLRFFEAARYGKRVDAMAMYPSHATHCHALIVELLEQTKDRDAIIGSGRIDYYSC